MNVTIEIDANEISDWESFHTVFAKELGFPEFYGRNMNAWIDCMTCLDDKGAGMTATNAAPGHLAILHMRHTAEFQKRVPDVFAALVDCAAFVNFRRTEAGEEPVLALLLE